MTEVTNQLLLERLRKIQDEIDHITKSLDEQEILIERIENRLELCAVIVSDRA